MLLLSTSSLLVMIDLDKDNKPLPKTGLFRAFRSHPINSSHSLQLSSDNNNDFSNESNTSRSSNSRYRGYKQSFLRGHTKSIGLIEISEREMLMITGKCNKH